ncbi:MAG: YjbQ family protein [Ignavibacteria bacterium]|jgi:secondary thiamine-phosphate synthase enzyme|nr:YjbQ family protein [Ignavibacteria bacterium]MCU7504225.1 YjbQ family protein [Ignavibacteria bacterium]MCU7516070.1 YjbQ family protein [Ignavibacteria bacterium]
MNCFQKEIVISEKTRGFHLVTEEVLRQIPELRNFSAGIFFLFIQHTSASLSINENADPDVRHDMESYFNRSVPENAPYFEHMTEGSDDMPSHIKSSLLGSSISIPVTNGRLNLGTWQGIYLCEHRNRGGRRHLVATIMGERTHK